MWAMGSIDTTVSQGRLGKCVLANSSVSLMAP